MSANSDAFTRSAWIYIHMSVATYHYAVIGCIPANREDVLVVCLVTVHTTCYSTDKPNYW